MREQEQRREAIELSEEQQRQREAFVARQRFVAYWRWKLQQFRRIEQASQQTTADIDER
jgi:hypothetical protein